MGGIDGNRHGLLGDGGGEGLLVSLGNVLVGGEGGSRVLRLVCASSCIYVSREEGGAEGRERGERKRKYHQLLGRGRTPQCRFPCLR